jgi:hypothetical protein
VLRFKKSQKLFSANFLQFLTPYRAMSKKETIYKDERFAHLLKNPRFKTIPKRETKIKIDDRFKSMFENEKFNIQYNVDKYGRKINKKSAENLKNYYELESSGSSDEEEEGKPESDDGAIPGNAAIKGGNKLSEQLKDKLKNLEVDYIRGEGILQSDSSDDESSEEEEDVTVEHKWGELDRDAETTEDSTNRIACMHMDWDRIKAADIMILCNSFIPAGAGSVLSVKVSVICDFKCLIYISRILVDLPVRIWQAAHGRRGNERSKRNHRPYRHSSRGR